MTSRDILAVEETGTFFAEERATHHSPAITGQGGGVREQTVTAHSSTGIGLAPTPSLFPHERSDGRVAFLGPPLQGSGSAQAGAVLPWQATHPTEILPGQHDPKLDVSGAVAAFEKTRGRKPKDYSLMPPGFSEGNGPGFKEWDAYAGFWRPGPGEDWVPGGTPTHPELAYHLSGET